jgi:hypothetical protein
LECSPNHQHHAELTNGVSEAEHRAGHEALGISPRSLEDELEAILRQSKPRIS